MNQASTPTQSVNWLIRIILVLMFRLINIVTDICFPSAKTIALLNIPKKTITCKYTQ